MMEIKKKIIGFFRYSVNGDISNAFKPYIYLEKGISTLIDANLKGSYGDGLDLILFSWICYDKDSDITLISKPLSSYRKSEKSIEVKVNVTYDNFFGKSDEERRMFIIENIKEGLILVKDKLRKNKEVSIDFDLLIQDFQLLAVKYMEQ